MLEHVHVLYDTIPGQSDTASPSECFILRVRIRLSTEAQRYLGLVAPLHNKALNYSPTRQAQSFQATGQTKRYAEAKPLPTTIV